MDYPYDPDSAATDFDAMTRKTEKAYRSEIFPRPGQPRGRLCIAAVEAMDAGALMIVAVDRGGETLVQPSGDFHVAAGDGIAIVGRAERAIILKEIFSPAAVVTADA